MSDMQRWAPVLHYEGLYEVSDKGRVRSLSREHKTRGGGVAILPGKVLTPTKTNQLGHLAVYLSPPGRMKGRPYVHRLVLDAFVEPRPDGMECRHLDGDPTNNTVENLAWGTRSENNLDRVRHGTHQHTRRTHCPKGHPLDGVMRRSDGTVKQRFCRECSSQRQKDKHAKNMVCKQGHLLDGVAYHPDGTVWQRFCKTCRSERVRKQMIERHAENAVCDKGHPLDGRRQNGKRRFCTTCRNEHLAVKQQEVCDRDDWCHQFQDAFRASGLTQVQAAELLGVAQPSLSKWVLGQNAARADRRAEILQTLASVS